MSPRECANLCFERDLTCSCGTRYMYHESQSFPTFASTFSHLRFIRFVIQIVEMKLANQDQRQFEKYTRDSPCIMLEVNSTTQGSRYAF